MTEYSTDTIEMHEGHVQPGQRVLLVDDLIATGGTLKAGINLISKSRTHSSTKQGGTSELQAPLFVSDTKRNADDVSLVSSLSVRVCTGCREGGRCASRVRSGY